MAAVNSGLHSYIQPLMTAVVFTCIRWRVRAAHYIWLTISYLDANRTSYFLCTQQYGCNPDKFTSTARYSFLTTLAEMLTQRRRSCQQRCVQTRAQTRCCRDTRWLRAGTGQERRGTPERHVRTRKINIQVICQPVIQEVNNAQYRLNELLIQWRCDNVHVFSFCYDNVCNNMSGRLVHLLITLAE